MVTPVTESLVRGTNAFTQKPGSSLTISITLIVTKTLVNGGCFFLGGGWGASLRPIRVPLTLVGVKGGTNCPALV